MQTSNFVNERFALEHIAGKGGMGEVWRARERQSGELRAVKIMRSAHAGSSERFEREARVIAELTHPAIVRYVDHGVTPSGERFLVMEWLDGEDLACRLERGKLTVRESVVLVTRLAEALAVAHARGIVHRDIKPSNVFLVEGDVARAKLLDFGISQIDGSTRLTRTGAVLGTPGYMSPEQASGSDQCDARADVFSIGCVLYECLTGTAAFPGHHVMAILAKILLEEPPSIRGFVPELPSNLDSLVATLLAKDPEKRPRDGAALVDLLAALESRNAEFFSSVSTPTIGRRERQAITLLLIEKEKRSASDALTRGDDATALDTAGLRRLAEALRGRFEALCDGSAVLLFTGIGTATDLAAQGARAALALTSRIPGQTLVLASGRAELSGILPASDTLDRAASMLVGRANSTPFDAPSAIRLDAVTAGLLDARFEVKEIDTTLFLCHERELPASIARTPLGKPTQCVGREPELRMLEAALAACIDGSCVRVILVTTNPGGGKSRLQHEFVKRVRNQDEGFGTKDAESDPQPQMFNEDVEVWFARGDSMRAEVPLGLLGQLVRNAARLSGGEPLPVRREKLRARVALHVEAPLRRRVTAFLGEIAGVRIPGEDDIELRAARQDPKLYADQIRQSFADFLQAECRVHPLLIVLDDLHWGDAASVEQMDLAFRLALDLPLLVLALARPEVHERFPTLWAQRGLSEIRLGRLSRKACERFVRDVLGESLSGDKIASIVSRSDGNAFLLEELVRAAAEMRDELPGTVLAMMHSRIEAFPAEARRVLRAGSILGEVFWRGSLDVLVGGGSSLDECLELLEKSEMLVRHRDTSFPGEIQYSFRHGLVRDAAYEMLTDADRALGHKLAGEWLERAGEPSAMVIAQHFDRGGDFPRAAGFYCRAAEQALEASDFAAVITHASRAEACDPRPEDRGKLQLLLSEAHFWRGDIAQAALLAREALDALPRGTDRWFAAAQKAVEAAERLGRSDEVLSLASMLAENHKQESSSHAEAIALSFTGSQCSSIGAQDWASKLLSLVDAMEGRIGDEPRVLGAVASGRAMFAFMTGDVEAHWRERQSALAAFERAGHTRGACHERCWLAVATMELGNHDEAHELLDVVLAEAQRLELRVVAAAAKYCLGTTLARLGLLSEARDKAISAVADFVEQGDARRIASSRAALADVLVVVGELERAEEEARRAIEAGRAPWLWFFMATLADVLLARGLAKEALEVVTPAYTAVASSLHVVGEAKIRLVFAKALAATDNAAKAREVIFTARERLLDRSARISNSALRRTFLERVPENERTFAFARDALANL